MLRLAAGHPVLPLCRSDLPHHAVQVFEGKVAGARCHCHCHTLCVCVNTALIRLLCYTHCLQLCLCGLQPRGGASSSTLILNRFIS